MQSAERWWSKAAAPILLSLICVCFFWKLTLTNRYTWLDSPDNANQVLPWYQFEATEWHAGRLPLWDPYLWGGQPLLAQAQPGAAYPPNWPLFLAPLREGRIPLSHLNWYFVLIHIQAALFCYWLCRDLKRSRPASLLSGMAFALGGYVGVIGWPQMLNGAVWAPVVVLFFLRAMRGERPVSSAAWSGACLGISLLSGHHQIPVFIGLTMGGLWLYYFLTTPARVPVVKLLLVFSTFAVLLSALQTLPAYEYGKLSLRWVGAANAVGWKDDVPYYVHQRYAFYPQSLVGIVIPGMFRNADPYIGITALVLALFGILGAWRDRMTRVFSGIALGGLIFSLGHNAVFHGVLYALVPMVEKARSPSMAIFIFHFGVSVLIAYGTDSFPFLSRAIVKRSVLLLCAFSAVMWAAVWILHSRKIPTDGRLGVVILAGLGLALTLLIWNRVRFPAVAACAALGLLMGFELNNEATYGYQLLGNSKSLLKPLSEDSDIAAFLKSQDSPARAEIADTDVAYNFGDWYGIDHFGGYLASMTLNVDRVQGSTRARQMYGVNFRVAREPRLPSQVEVFTSQTGVKVFRDSTAFPRAWIVHEALSIDRDDQINTYDEPDFDPRLRTFVKGPAPQLENCREPEQVSLVSRDSETVVLDATLHCRGMVIESDTYFPGWVATVDGHPAPLYEAYGFLRGIVVDAGTHRIEMRYRPKSVYIGAAMSALGLLGAIVLTGVRW